MNNKVSVSVVCVYNNEEVFNKQLISSLKNQDIDYEVIGINNNIEKYESAAKALNVGAAGAKEKIRTHFGVYTSGPEYNSKYKEVDWDKKAVSCIDECFFCMRKETFLLYQFNEELCDNWHLYGVELSLRARKAGNSVYVLTIQIHHFSYGRISIGYMRGLQKIVKAYHKDFKYVWTTCFKVPASPLYMKILFYIWYCNRKLRRIGLD